MGCFAAESQASIKWLVCWHLRARCDRCKGAPLFQSTVHPEQLQKLNHFLQLIRNFGHCLRLWSLRVASFLSRESVYASKP